MKCVCGEQLKYIPDSSGCGDLRCISCTRSSGYCSDVSDAMKQFKRKYKCELEVQGMNELTREQILAMPAGRELDKLVALNVMGYEDAPHHEGYVKKNGLITSPKRYSSDIAAAWEVVDKVPIDVIHPYAGFRLTKLGNQIIVSFDGTECSAKDAAEGICKCALLAVMGL